MRIDPKDLSPDALQGLLESFVLREGTDYGAVELSLGEKVGRLRRQLEIGKVVIVYDEVLESVTILPAHELEPKV
ncbi:MAG: YheU family protein [Gammaproteobacteria bacterium]|nr:MAG: YheU family protein [Gammaproteobacteria bacterium]